MIKKIVLVVVTLHVFSATAQTNGSSNVGREQTYSYFGAPDLPVEIEETNTPIELESVYLGRKACSDYSGEGVEKFLKSGRHPKKYDTGKLTIRATKPTIKRQLRYRKGTPAHLTVTSFKDSCLGVLVRGSEQSQPQTQKVVKQAVEKQTKSLSDEVKSLRQRVEALEERLDALEN